MAYALDTLFSEKIPDKTHISLLPFQEKLNNCLEFSVSNVSSLSRHHIALICGIGLTAASFFISGGTIPLLCSGVVGGVGLNLSYYSYAAISEESSDTATEKLFGYLAIGAANGVVSTLGNMLLFSEGENLSKCNNCLDVSNLMVTSAMTGFVTGGVNGIMNRWYEKQQNSGKNISILTSASKESSTNIATTLCKIAMTESIRKAKRDPFPKRRASTNGNDNSHLQSLTFSSSPPQVFAKLTKKTFFQNLPTNSKSSTCLQFTTQNKPMLSTLSGNKITFSKIIS
ncbi:hypothetical protein RFI_23304 [Reticulomyxa filosa]|uniref:Uncharacterized protein n=1 Tax=Reticulomyxa filosa TaxID=46433 RepID=X6MJN2_RETFI|nr:hypothetical protein RFI_23304 [Reticulomyxa filosa]|eukprot:ETO14064.1 hypothetical protein RFI_23304 [Reticulomyxa filosa]